MSDSIHVKDQQRLWLMFPTRLVTQPIEWLESLGVKVEPVEIQTIEG